MEGAEKKAVDEELAIDWGIAEDNIRLKEKFNSNSIITSMRMKPTSKSRFQIPLCWMTSLPDVRPVLGPDVEKLIADFAHGYREGDRVFYVSIHDGRGKMVPVTDEHRSSWNKHWIAENETFETMLQSDRDFWFHSPITCSMCGMETIGCMHGQRSFGRDIMMNVVGISR